MILSLENPAVCHNHNLIGTLNDRQVVGNDDHRLVFHETLKRFHNCRRFAHQQQEGKANAHPVGQQKTPQRRYSPPRAIFFLLLPIGCID